MTEEQKKHIEECTTKASTNACNAIEELIDEFDDIIKNNPDDDELCLEVQRGVLAACSTVFMRGLITMELNRGYFLNYALRLWESANEVRDYNEKEKDA